LLLGLGLAYDYVRLRLLALWCRANAFVATKRRKTVQKAPSKPENLRTDNRVATLEAARAEFEASWRQWLAWVELGEVE
jgi:hypothetical protein